MYRSLNVFCRFRESGGRGVYFVQRYAQGIVNGFHFHDQTADVGKHVITASIQKGKFVTAIRTEFDGKISFGNFCQFLNGKIDGFTKSFGDQCSYDHRNDTGNDYHNKRQDTDAVCLCYNDGLWNHAAEHDAGPADFFVGKQIRFSIKANIIFSGIFFTFQSVFIKILILVNGFFYNVIL